MTPTQAGCICGISMWCERNGQHQREKDADSHWKAGVGEPGQQDKRRTEAREDENMHPQSVSNASFMTNAPMTSICTALGNFDMRQTGRFGKTRSMIMRT